MPAFGGDHGGIHTTFYSSHPGVVRLHFGSGTRQAPVAVIWGGACDRVNLSLGMLQKGFLPMAPLAAHFLLPFPFPPRPSTMCGMNQQPWLDSLCDPTPPRKARAEANTTVACLRRSGWLETPPRMQGPWSPAAGDMLRSKRRCTDSAPAMRHQCVSRTRPTHTASGHGSSDGNVTEPIDKRTQQNTTDGCVKENGEK